ncbi:interleukin-21 [Cyclopterus lumpus]|uniref:interleukin-21 n=1 Tax=Cyclopterus lumpus TaxID=8103 RepID=UPI001486580E|nr:interleukin-21 [Cyclopterus lumpus]
MKLVVFCLFAVWCGSLVGASPRPNDRTLQRKLTEVLRQLNSVRRSLQHGEKMLSTPPLSVEDCCCLSALQCFQENLHVQFNVTERTQGKLYKSLKSPITKRGLCISTKSGDVQATCQDCDSHPKENAREFFNRLESLIQKGITRLS